MTDTPIRKRHWEARELVLVGVFAAAAKLSSLLIALAGGGSSTLPPDIAKEESGLGNHMFFLGLNHRF